MARGVRTNATLLPTFSPNLQPQSMSSYDPLTRRNTILVATIVPTLKDGESNDLLIPADRYYVHLGSAQASTGNHPRWLGGSLSNATLAQWDATQKQQYMRISSVGTPANFGASTSPAFVYPTGPFGVASSFAPKNVSSSAVWGRFTARFNANADYGATGGIGANNGSSSEFSTATNHFIQVTRNSGNWELGTCDGSTISQTASSGGGDGSFHEFAWRWVSGEVTLYVDSALVVTKTTNIPTRPLFVMGVAADNTNTIDIVDYLVEWET